MKTWVCAAEQKESGKLFLSQFGYVTLDMSLLLSNLTDSS